MKYSQVPLHQLPPESRLFVIEFKAGRTDIFFSGDSALQIGLGDVCVLLAIFDKRAQLSDLCHLLLTPASSVIVEADRGKDLGSVVHDNISLSDVQAFQKHQVEQALSQLAASQSQNQAPNPQTISRLTRVRSFEHAQIGCKHRIANFHILCTGGPSQTHPVKGHAD